jgi:O-antigen/teichoic acid export membrane protein
LRERLRHLTTGVAIYGAGDAAIQIVNFALLLVYVYVKGGFLTSVDYGALALIGAVEAFAKVASRWGLDGAFMRYYHERGDAMPRFTSTILWFLLAVNVVVFGIALALTGPIAGRIFDDPSYVVALRLMLLNIFLVAFTFVPFHTMRLRNEAATYSAFTFARSVGQLILRIVCVISLGMGITGWYVADVAVTVVLLPMMWPWFRAHLTRTFSTDDLRVALRFALPRVPNGIAQQMMDGGNKLLLNGYITQAQLGIYQNAVTLGTGVKFFTSAFETAWAPFYYATARTPDAKAVFRKMTTYGVAVLALLVAGTAAVARDAVLVVLTPDYLAAAPILPIVAIGMAFQGLYLLTSIGINLTSRTELYPVSTFAAAAVGIIAGILLMPSYGAIGAAVAFLLSYFTQALVAFLLAQQLYPIEYEGGRLVRIVLAGAVAALVALWVVPALPPLAGLAVRGATTVGVYVGLLWASGFLRASERAFLHELVGRMRRGPLKARTAGDV